MCCALKIFFVSLCFPLSLSLFSYFFRFRSLLIFDCFNLLFLPFDLNQSKLFIIEYVYCLRSDRSTTLEDFSPSIRHIPTIIPLGKLKNVYSHSYVLYIALLTFKKIRYVSYAFRASSILVSIFRH